MPTQFEKDVSVWHGKETCSIPKSELTYIDFPDQKHVFQKQTTLIATGTGQVLSKSGDHVCTQCWWSPAVAKPCDQCNSAHLELRLAYQNCACHVWLIVIPVCADMGRHVFMVFWSCRWFLPPAYLLFVMLEVRVPGYVARHLVGFLEYTIHKRTVATWRSDAATLRGCFVNWWCSPASPLKSLWWSQAVAKPCGPCNSAHLELSYDWPINTLHGMFE